MLQRGTSLTGHRRMFREQILHGIGAYWSSMNVGKEDVGISAGRFFQPCFQDSGRVFCDWCATFLAALALTMDVCTWAKGEIPSTKTRYLRQT
jgi:hypothetical protein